MRLHDALKISKVECILDRDSSTYPQARKYHDDDTHFFLLHRNCSAEKKYIVARQAYSIRKEIIISYNLFTEDGTPVSRNPELYYGSKYFSRIVDKDDWEPFLMGV